MEARNGQDGINVALKEEPDLILCDVMMPVKDGYETCREIKNDPKMAQTPVVMLTAKVESEDVITGIEAGADDYITKPFDLPELLARITVQLRNTSPHLAVRHILTFQEIKLNTETHRVSVQKHPVKLTKTEYAILKLLMERPSQVMTKSALLEQISEDTPDCMESSLKVHISNLRKKLKTITDKDYIEAVWGIGFKMKED